MLSTDSTLHSNLLLLPQEQGETREDSESMQDEVAGVEMTVACVPQAQVFTARMAAFEKLPLHQERRLGHQDH